MKKRSTAFKILDVLYILIITLPLVAGMTLKVLFSPATEGVHISGALVYFTIKMPLADLPVTETQIRRVSFFYARTRRSVSHKKATPGGNGGGNGR